MKDDHDDAVTSEEIAADARVISLRDYFAGQAINAIGIVLRVQGAPEQPAAVMAESAYAVADAMLKARAK